MRSINKTTWIKRIRKTYIANGHTGPVDVLENSYIS